MSRKFIRNLAVATLTAATLIAGSAGAMAMQNIAGHPGTKHPGNNHPGNNHPGNKHPGNHPNVHRHDHPHFVKGHIRIRRVFVRGYVEPVRYAVPVVGPGPCTCLTKDYTPEGVVVFRDLCTKEMASAPVGGMPAQAGEIASPTNFAGKTYQDYLAANPQAAPVATQKN